MVVWKYQLDVRQNQLVHMPIDALVIEVGVQNDYPVLWVITEGKGVELAPRVFSVVTTGEEFELSKGAHMVLHYGHVGTVTLGKDMTSGNPSAWYVAHVFEGSIKVLDNKIEDRREIAKELSSAVPSE